MLLSHSHMSTAGTASALLSLLLLDGVQGLALPGIDDTQFLDSTQGLNNTQPLTGFAPCDALIAANLSHLMHLPSSPIYPDLVNNSWAATTQRRPYCFAQPSTVDEVSRTLTALQSAGNGAGDWHVAIRSGGHASDYASSIDTGVTIDLTLLNATTYDAATNIASLGTGARWGQVYADLEQQHGVLVTGGREGIVGVGGLLLGGGVSWYNARTGYACDSVINYEVVLADGRIINANASAHSDLWRALKGGGCNFGLVTRFDVEAFPAHNLSFATRTFVEDHKEELVDALVGFTNLDKSFQDNAWIGMRMYNPDAGIITTAYEVNTVNDADTTAFDAFNQIPTTVPPTKVSMSLADSANSSTISGDTVNAGAGPLTLMNDAKVIRYCIDEYDSLIEHLKTTLGPKSFTTIMDIQPLPSYFTDISEQKGGNVLGLGRDPRNKVFFAPGVTLLTPASQAQLPQVVQQVAALVQRIKAYAKSVGGSDEWVYLAYADAAQDPLGSYGAANVDYMKRTAKKYDPQGFFQEMVPGGFKIDRVDLSSSLALDG